METLIFFTIWGFFWLVTLWVISKEPTMKQDNDKDPE